MPARRQWVRVSVRRLEESQDSDWGSVEQSYTHKRYQTLNYLTAFPGRRMSKLSRSEYEADWSAKGRRRPEIKDGDRLVVEDGSGNDELILDVEGTVVEGQYVFLALKERGRAQ